MRLPTRQLLNKKILVLINVALILLIGLAVFVTNKQKVEINAETNNSPDYATILPNNKTITSLGGWTRISPPENDPVFAYTDTINNVPITVSEQPLPESFKSDIPSGVANLANNFNATTKLNAKSTDFYIGTSATGPQSVIFVKNSVLVLIKSQKKIDDTSWSAYIESLQLK
jgi:hypothetical protein